MKTVIIAILSALASAILVLFFTIPIMKQLETERNIARSYALRALEVAEEKASSEEALEQGRILLQRQKDLMRRSERPLALK